MVMKLEQLSRDISAIVEKNEKSIVTIRARRGAPSTGVVWPGSGGKNLSVCANHTLQREEDVEVLLPGHDGTTSAARLVGRDPTTDLAVLESSEIGQWVPTWETPTLKLGALVVTLASTGRGARAGLSLVSRLGAEWQTQGGARIDKFLEIAAPLFRGFSGTLVLDDGGRAVGLATSGLVPKRSLVVPTRTIRRVVEQLQANGRIQRGYLGITTYPVPLPEEAAAPSQQSAGLLILSVAQGSPAAKAGLYLGDVLLTANEIKTDIPMALVNLLDEESIGHSLSLEILRAGARKTASVTVGAR